MADYGGGGGGGFSSGPSDKQLAFIFSLQKRLQLADDQLKTIVKDLFKAEGLEGLSRGEASELIDDLKTRAEEAGVDKAPMTGPASEKQIKFMKSLKRKAKLDDAAFGKLLQEIAHVDDVENVQKKEASELINKLIELTGGTPTAAPGARGGGRGKAKAPGAKAASREAPSEGGSAPDERPPERPDDGPPPTEDDELPF
jgi:hypothetical protein